MLNEEIIVVDASRLSHEIFRHRTMRGASDLADILDRFISLLIQRLALAKAMPMSPSMTLRLLRKHSKVWMARLLKAAFCM